MSMVDGRLHCRGPATGAREDASQPRPADIEDPTDPAFEDATYRKVTWRLMPFLFLCYILAYVDRINVGFAKLQMQADLEMTDAVYGIGAGLFFIGYFFFEVPSNVILQRIGARRWIGPIMITWGVVSSATMFVRTSTEFYILRFALGIVESGFFPGVILYLTFWYTRRHRARMVAVFMSAIALSGVFGGPVSGWIMAAMQDAGQLRAWQWLFLLEGIPSVIVGIIALYFLDDNPAKAKWLTAAERNLLVWRLEQEESFKQRQGAAHNRLVDAFRRPIVWLFCLVYFGMVMGNYGVGFWLPQIIKDLITNDLWKIGLVSMIPWGVGALAMIYWGRRSDLKGERHWHIATAAIVGSVAFAASGLPGIHPALAIAALSFATAGVMASFSTFWALPADVLSGSAAAAGIAWINSVGNLAGYVSPFVVGHIRDSTGNMTYALLVLSFSLLMSALIVIALGRKMPRSAPKPT